MDGWMDGWMERWSDGFMNKLWINNCVYGRMDE